MNAAIETRLPDGPSSRSKIRPGGHGPRAVAFSFGLTARGACLLLAHSFCVPTKMAAANTGTLANHKRHTTYNKATGDFRLE